MGLPPTVLQPDEYATREALQHKSRIFLNNLNAAVQQQMKLVIELDEDGIGARTRKGELVQVIERTPEPSVWQDEATTTRPLEPGIHPFYCCHVGHGSICHFGSTLGMYT